MYTAQTAIITVQPKGAGLGLTGTDRTIYFERRGSANKLEWHLPGEYHVELFEGLKDGTLLSVMRTDGASSRVLHETLAGRAAAAALLEQYLREAGHEFAVSPLTVAYTYAPTCHYEYEKSDVHIVPARYDSGIRTIVDTDTDMGILIFTDDELANMVDEPAAPPELIEAAADGFTSWVHDCDRAHGIDSCRRRIAWLTASYLLKNATTPLRCTLLQRDMETPYALSPR